MSTDDVRPGEFGHCRHKIFNADFIIDGAAMPLSLFAMIARPTRAIRMACFSAYRDKRAVIEGPVRTRFFPDL